MLFSVHHFFKQSVVTMPLGVCMVYMMPCPLSVFAKDMAFLVSSLAFLPLLASPILFAFILEAADCAWVLGNLPTLAMFALMLSVAGLVLPNSVTIVRCFSVCFFPAKPLNPLKEPPSNPDSGLKFNQSSDPAMFIISDIFSAVSTKLSISVNKQYQSVATLSLPWRLI